uniref:Secreted protein n=1 Tax=Oryza barthii TaxID=65489 RepID=A0A0D3F2C9_9ORYZ
MGAARLRIRLQAVLVMSLLLLQIMPFLPCTLATGGNSAELLIMGREKHAGHLLLAPTKSTRSRRILYNRIGSGGGNPHWGMTGICMRD